MDIGPKGMVTHTSSEKINDGNGEREANAKDRLKKHGSIISCYGENLSFHCVDAKEVLMGLLVDDGSKTRGHRHNILNPDFNYMGCFTVITLILIKCHVLIIALATLQKANQIPLNNKWTNF